MKNLASKLTQILISLNLLFAAACEPNTQKKWVKNDSTYADLNQALQHAELCKVLILRNEMPNGQNISQVKTIDNTISGLVHLEKLIIYGIAQKEIPPEIIKLSKLKSLEIYYYANKSFTLSLPENLSYLSHLESLSIEGCGLKAIPKLPQSLKILNLKKNALTLVESSIFSFSIEKIDLSFNAISTFSISKPNKTIKYLNISNNKLEKIPKELGSLQNLEFLGISNNPLIFDSLQNKPGELVRLEAICIEQNVIENLIDVQTKHVWLSNEPWTNKNIMTEKYQNIDFIWFGLPYLEQP